MTRRWVGPTPWDSVAAHPKDNTDQAMALAAGYAYREAMNSPEVRGLANTIRTLAQIEFTEHGATPVAMAARAALRAYDVGLEPEQKVSKVADGKT